MEKLTVNRLLEALTDENKVLNFPVKYPAIELDRKTKDVFLLTAGIIAGGMIISALIKSNFAKK